MAGSRKRKRRKKVAKLWAEFQEEFQLSEETVALARATGYPIDRIRERLGKMDRGLSHTRRIEMLHASWREKLEKRRAAIEAGEIQSKPKKEKKKEGHDPAWAKAKSVCCLNQEDIRMAKKLGLKPRALMKNVPSPSQRWKAPVKVWIRDLYEKTQEKMAVRERRKKEHISKGNNPAG